MLLVHHACYSLFLQTATVCSQHTCIILLHHTDTALLHNRLFQSDTVSSGQSVGDNSLKVQQAVTALWRFCVCNKIYCYPTWMIVLYHIHEDNS